MTSLSYIDHDHYNHHPSHTRTRAHTYHDLNRFFKHPGLFYISYDHPCTLLSGLRFCRRRIDRNRDILRGDICLDLGVNRSHNPQTKCSVSQGLLGHCWIAQHFITNLSQDALYFQFRAFPQSLKTLKT